MKKVTLDMMLGKRTRCHYKKNIPKTIIARANLPVGVATKSQSLGSLLGQYGLNAIDFCELFNKNSVLIWDKNQEIPIVILISPAKTYIIEYKIPTVYSLFNRVFKFRTKPRIYFLKPRNRKLLVATAYKIAIIKAQTTNPQIVRKFTRQILSSFRSYNPFSYLRFSKPTFNFRKKIRNIPPTKKPKKK